MGQEFDIILGDLNIVEQESGAAKEARLKFIREEQERLRAQEQMYQEELLELRKTLPEKPRVRLTPGERRRRQTDEQNFENWMGLNDPRLRAGITRGSVFNTLIRVLGPIASLRKARAKDDSVASFPSLAREQHLSAADVERLQIRSSFVSGSVATTRLNQEPLLIEWPTIILSRWPADCAAAEKLRDEYVSQLLQVQGQPSAAHVKSYALLDQKLEIMEALVYKAKRHVQTDFVNIKDSERMEFWTELDAAQEYLKRLRASARRFKIAPTDFRVRRFNGGSIEDFLEFCYSNGLEVDRASPQDEQAYLEIFRKIQAYARDVVLIENRKEEVEARIGELQQDDRELMCSRRRRRRDDTSLISTRRKDRMMAETPVGIDLGTTFSVVAYVDPLGRPTSIRNLEGDITTPSVVLFEPNDRGEIDKDPVIGREAVNASVFMPDCVADMAKRDMGQDLYSRTVAGKSWRPELLQSFVLEKLKRDAEAAGKPFDRAVITVPAYFNNSRRERTMEAARLAGIETLAIINEPTAAALVYGTQEGFIEEGVARQREVIMVYDLGGGTFDVTLLEINGRDFRVLATDGDVELGGRDWDKALVDHIAEAFKEANRGRDPREDPRGLQRLYREAEQAKRALSSLEKTVVMIEHGGDALRLPITRAEFEEQTEDLLERTLFTSSKVVRSAQLTWQDVTRILLVGGSTKMPAVERRLLDESGIQASKVLAADEAVAHGAALYAGILLTRSGHTSTAPVLAQIAVQDVTSHDLGLIARDPRTNEARISVIIPKASPLPASGQRKYRIRVGQQKIRLAITEGGVQIFEGVVPLPNPSPNCPDPTRIAVTYRYDDNGCLTVQVGFDQDSAVGPVIRVFNPDREPRRASG
ncbi:Chaperone protein DnaK (HSP70) (Heat shock 70 kDa protein) (Heat shock protein 70) [Durusdinium trenchii]|uniref:Chaperone protein DnaK (HSP70) (Heat shock 70 kDa protein) (Heat shock protein 70) n=1 Tax=Durusdinium trenchii TaxID=1381693 RepID=A0ABP0SSI6_9DINO